MEDKEEQKVPSEEFVYDHDTGLRIYSKQEIEAYKGKYDKDGFYTVEEEDGAGFFDNHGFYFDKDGFNKIGGSYDPETGEYRCPPDDFGAEMDDYYDEELYGEENDQSGPNEDQEEYHSELTSIEYSEHVIPTVQWIQEQPSDMMHVLKILNLPRRATQEMLTKFLKKHIKGFKYDKIKLEMDGIKTNKGTAWVSTNDRPSASQIVKLHYQVSVLL